MQNSRACMLDYAEDLSHACNAGTVRQCMQDTPGASMPEEHMRSRVHLKEGASVRREALSLTTSPRYSRP